MPDDRTAATIAALTETLTRPRFHTHCGETHVPGPCADGITRTAAAEVDNPRNLTLGRHGVKGALPGCPGQIELEIDNHNCGSWSSPCYRELSLDCNAKGCWWSRGEWDGPVDADLFAEAAIQHAADALTEAQP